MKKWDSASEKILALTGMSDTPGICAPHFELESWGSPTHIHIQFLSEGSRIPSGQHVRPSIHYKDKGILLSNQQGHAFKAKLLELCIPFLEYGQSFVRMTVADFIKATHITAKELNEEFEEKLFDESPAAGL